MPRGEQAVAVITPDDLEFAHAMADRYRDAIRTVVGWEPPGARLRVEEYSVGGKPAVEVICEYDAGVLQAAEYAGRCAELAPRTWSEAGLPVPPQNAS